MRMRRPRSVEDFEAMRHGPTIGDLIRLRYGDKPPARAQCPKCGKVRGRAQMVFLISKPLMCIPCLRAAMGEAIEGMRRSR